MASGETLRPPQSPQLSVTEMAVPLWVGVCCVPHKLGLCSLRCAGSSQPAEIPPTNSQAKHMFPRRPPSHLPLGNEWTSAQLLAGALTGAHLLRKCPAWINTARLCLPRPDQAGQEG